MRFQTIAYAVALASGLASGIVFPEVPFEGVCKYSSSLTLFRAILRFLFEGVPIIWK